MSISSMRSKKTSRYKKQHPHEFLNNNNNDKSQDIYGQLNLLFAEKGSELILVYLDKHDVQVMSQGKLNNIEIHY